MDQRTRQGLRYPLRPLRAAAAALLGAGALAACGTSQPNIGPDVGATAVAATDAAGGAAAPTSGADVEVEVPTPEVDINVTATAAGQASEPTAGVPATPLPTVSAAPGEQPTVGPVATQGSAAQIPQAAQGDFPYVSVGQIDVNPRTYVGQRVTAYGEVDAQLGPNSFRVDEGNFLNIAGQILLVVPEGSPRPDNLQNETSIAITGMVQPYSADLGNTYNVQFDDPSIEGQLDGQPVLVADIVYTQATVSDIDDDSEAYLGDRVTVRGDVTGVVDQNTFRLNDPGTLGGDDILVFMRDASGAPLTSVSDGEGLLVTGEVRAFDRSALESELGYTWNDADLNGFNGATVIIADLIQRPGAAPQQ